MKNIGLVIATKREFNTIFLPEYGLVCKEVQTNPFVVHLVEIDDKRIYAILAGVGQTMASAATQHLIDKFNVSVILNYGVVGALVDNLGVKSTVLVDKIIDYEYDTTPIEGEVLGWHKDTYPEQFLKADRKLIEMAQKVDPSLQKVICASGNKFIVDINFKNELNKKFGAEICEMESAGIALIAHKNNVPVLYIKGVSDSRTGGADEFNNMILVSSAITYKLLLKIVKEL